MRPVARGEIWWALATAVLVHGALRRFEPHGALPGAALLGFAIGFLPLLPAAWGRGPAALARAALRSLLPAALAVAVTLLLDALGAGLLVHAVAFALLAAAALLDAGCAGRLRVLLGVEWLKLRKGRLLRGGLAVAVAATLLTGLTHEPLEGEAGWAVAARSMGAGFWAAEILLIVLGATAVAGEIGQGTMKMILPHAYRRAEWIAAKAVVLGFAALLFALLVAATAVAHAAATAGLDDVVKLVPAGFGQDDELQVFQTADAMRGHLQDTVLAASASLVTSALLGLLLSCLFDALVPALSAAFLLFVFLKVGDVLLGFPRTVLEGLYTRYPDQLRELTIRLGRGFNERWDPTLLPQGAHLALITGMLGLLGAMRLFGRRDLHG